VLSAVVLAACSQGHGTTATTTATTASTATPPAATTTLAQPAAGPNGIGDPYFPSAGSPGIDVQREDLALTWDPASSRFAGTATIVARATADLSQIDLDLQGMSVSAATIGGSAVPVEQREEKLELRPAGPISRGSRLNIVVTYAGAPTPGVLSFPAAGLELPNGFRVERGVGFALSEPFSAHRFFPCSDHPSDKALFSVAITTPRGVASIASGRLVSQTSTGGAVTRRFVEDRPMATYLLQLAVGPLRLTRPERAADGVVYRSASLPVYARRTAQAVARARAMLDWFSARFGRYPFGEYGLLVVDYPEDASLETQSLPVYPGAIVGDESLLAHELAHQWFGDAVTPVRWSDIWLNEGFATYASWLWLDHSGTSPMADSAAGATDQLNVLNEQVALGDPGVENMFSATVYLRGALLLHSLGDERAVPVLRAWYRAHRYGNGSTDQFVALAGRITGLPASYFDRWLAAGPLPT
jgi:aminopeptidase N